jgi:hypothetical protein
MDPKLRRPMTVVPTDVTLRDFFAAAALQGLLADHQSHPIDYEDFAKAAFAHADAMLRVREREPGEPPPGRRFI